MHNCSEVLQKFYFQTVNYPELYYIFDVSLQDIVGSVGATFLYHQALESAALYSFVATT